MCGGHYGNHAEWCSARPLDAENVCCATCQHFEFHGEVYFTGDCNWAAAHLPPCLWAHINLNVHGHSPAGAVPTHPEATGCLCWQRHHDVFTRIAKLIDLRAQQSRERLGIERQGDI
jgi:hypothetical protein